MLHAKEYHLPGEKFHGGLHPCSGEEKPIRSPHISGTWGAASPGSPGDPQARLGEKRREMFQPVCYILQEAAPNSPDKGGTGTGDADLTSRILLLPLSGKQRLPSTLTMNAPLSVLLSMGLPHLTSPAPLVPPQDHCSHHQHCPGVRTQQEDSGNPKLA